MTNPLDLEQKKFFRLIKVTYFLSIIYFLFVSSQDFDTVFDSIIINEHTSYIQCNNGETIPFIDFSEIKYNYEVRNELKIIKACGYKINDSNLKAKRSKINLYSISVIKNNNAEMGFMIGLSLSVLLAMTFAINLAFQIVLYIVYGRKPRLKFLL